MSGNTHAPRCSKGMRTAHRPRLPPTMDGDAESSKPCRSLNGCGRYRDTQSIAFLSSPGIEELYSGETTTKASLASSRRRNASTPGGNPPPSWSSWSYEGESNSCIDARSTVPPSCVIDCNELSQLRIQRCSAQ